MLSETLLSARADILHFLFMYTLLLLCFALTAMSYFGANLSGFSTLLSSLVTLIKLNAANSKFDYRGGYHSYSPMSNVFFLCFMLVFLVAMVNTLTAIVIQHYVD
jgi:hypothetical protein